MAKNVHLATASPHRNTALNIGIPQALMCILTNMYGSKQLLKRCASIAVQLLYAIRILTVTISVHTVTNMYGSNSC